MRHRQVHGRDDPADHVEVQVERDVLAVLVAERRGDRVARGGERPHARRSRRPPARRRRPRRWPGRGSPGRCAGRAGSGRGRRDRARPGQPGGPPAHSRQAARRWWPSRRDRAGRGRRCRSCAPTPRRATVSRAPRKPGDPRRPWCRLPGCDEKLSTLRRWAAALERDATASLGGTWQAHRRRLLRLHGGPGRSTRAGAPRATWWTRSRGGRRPGCRPAGRRRSKLEAAETLAGQLCEVVRLWDVGWTSCSEHGCTTFVCSAVWLCPGPPTHEIARVGALPPPSQY